MQIISKVVFENENVLMDNRHFVDCCLLECVLEYSGKELTIERTEFRGCRLKLTEEAGRTLHFLQCLGFTQDVDGSWHGPVDGLPGFSARMN